MNNTLEHRDGTGQQAHDVEHNGVFKSSGLWLYRNDAGPVCQVL